jgi:hypothetical protein
MGLDITWDFSSIQEVEIGRLSRDESGVMQEAGPTAARATTPILCLLPLTRVGRLFSRIRFKHTVADHRSLAVSRWVGMGSSWSLETSFPSATTKLLAGASMDSEKEAYSYRSSSSNSSNSAESDWRTRVYNRHHLLGIAEVRMLHVGRSNKCSLRTPLIIIVGFILLILLSTCLYAVVRRAQLRSRGMKKTERGNMGAQKQLNKAKGRSKQFAKVTHLYWSKHGQEEEKEFRSQGWSQLNSEPPLRSFE